MASAFNEQYFLAHQRFLKVKNGFKLTFTDFCGENLTFFEKNCPQFAVAIFLMETFYKDPYMFFEKARDFVDFHGKNDIFEPLGDSIDFLQNNDTFEKMGDVGSQEKNVIFENLGDFADSHPKNGKFPITGDLADSQHKNGTFEIKRDLADSHAKNGSVSIIGFLPFSTGKKAIFALFQNGGFAKRSRLILIFLPDLRN